MLALNPSWVSEVSKHISRRNNASWICLFSGNKIPIQHLSFQHFLPETISYMTYEGSLTYPGCWETTVWIILNKPIFITKSEVSWYLWKKNTNYSSFQIGTFLPFFFSFCCKKSKVEIIQLKAHSSRFYGFYLIEKRDK